MTVGRLQLLPSTAWMILVAALAFGARAAMAEDLCAEYSELPVEEAAPAGIGIIIIH